MEQKSYQYQGKEMSYQLIGTANKTLVFVHGFCEDSCLWQEMASHLATTYRIICPDLPGFGQSATLPNWKMEDAATMLSVILDKEGVAHCCLIGHSLGGYVALAFAEAYPQRLLGLCLFHSHPYEDSEAKKEARQKTIGLMQRWGAAALVEELIPKLFAPNFRKNNF